MRADDLPEPPPPPEIRRRIRLYPYQWVGLALIALVPVLAWAGVFGGPDRVERARGAGLEVVVRYPPRMRFQQYRQIQVRVLNAGAARVDTIRVSLDTALVAHFGNVTAFPPFESAFELALPGVAPGEWRLAVVELRAVEHGRHSGMLTVAGPDTLRVPLSVFVFP